MFGLLHLLLLCAVACVGSVQIYEMCPGTSFYLPRLPEYDPETSNLSVTPESPPAKPLIVLKKTEPTDDRYQFKNGTLFISELREADTGTFSWEKDGNVHVILKLVIKDCAERKLLRVGRSMRLAIPRTALTLEFAPLSSRAAKEVLWASSGSAAKISRAYVEGSHWVLRGLTCTDSGSYTFRSQSGAELSKTQLTVKASAFYYNIDQDRSWEVSVPVPMEKVSLVYVPQSGGELLIIENGRRVHDDPAFEDYVMLDTEEQEDGVKATQVYGETSHKGTYKILDSDGNLLVLNVLGTEPVDGSVYLWALVPVCVLLLLLAVCCCCKKAKRNTRR